MGHIPEMYDDRYLVVVPPGGQEVVGIDHRPLLTAAEALNEFGFPAPLRAIVGASQKLFYVFSMGWVPYCGSPERDYLHDAQFLVTDDTFGTGSKRGFIEVRVDDGWVSFGRLHHTDRFDYPGTVSLAHFQIGCDHADNLYVRNLYPLNTLTLRRRPKVETDESDLA